MQHAHLLRNKTPFSKHKRTLENESNAYHCNVDNEYTNEKSEEETEDR